MAPGLEALQKMRNFYTEKSPRLCKNILGYDANPLYLSTMLREMPCGKERVVHYEDEYQTEAAPVLTHRLKEGSWFGFAKVDIEIPKPLHPKFEEMCPFFYNKVVPVEAVPEHMLKYLRDTGRKLVGELSAKRMLVYAPLLLWYVEHGAVITKVYRTIDYKPAKIFPWSVEQETRNKARRCWPRCSNFWETAGTGSSSKPWSSKKTFTPKMRR